MTSGESYSFEFDSYFTLDDDTEYQDGSEYYLNSDIQYLNSILEFKFEYKGSICEYPDEFEIICTNRLEDSSIPSYTSESSFLDTY